jgi:hypothetical protein
LKPKGIPVETGVPFFVKTTRRENDATGKKVPRGLCGGGSSVPAAEPILPLDKKMNRIRIGEILRSIVFSNTI